MNAQRVASDRVASRHVLAEVWRGAMGQPWVLAATMCCVLGTLFFKFVQRKRTRRRRRLSLKEKAAALEQCKAASAMDDSDASLPRLLKAAVGNEAGAVYAAALTSRGFACAEDLTLLDREDLRAAGVSSAHVEAVIGAVRQAVEAELASTEGRKTFAWPSIPIKVRRAALALAGCVRRVRGGVTRATAWPE